MKSKKYIVASGCSFTNNYKINIDTYHQEDRWKSDDIKEFTWMNWLREILGEDDYKFYNYGTTTNDNKTICRSIFYKVSDLVYNHKVNPKDIVVLAQWTTLTRNSWFVSPEKYDEIKKLDIREDGMNNQPPPHTTDYLNFNDKKYPYQR